MVCVVTVRNKHTKKTLDVCTLDIPGKTSLRTLASAALAAVRMQPGSRISHIPDEALEADITFTGVNLVATF